VSHAGDAVLYQRVGFQVLDPQAVCLPPGA
jgi:hypothetical protein